MAKNVVGTVGNGTVGNTVGLMNTNLNQSEAHQTIGYSCRGATVSPIHESKHGKEEQQDENVQVIVPRDSSDDKITRGLQTSFVGGQLADLSRRVAC